MCSSDLLVLGLALGLGARAIAPTAAAVMASLIGLVLYPFVLGGMAVLYVELRRLKGGLGAAAAAEVFA